MEKLKPGLYEQLISEHLKQELDAIPEARKATGELDYAEAPKVFAQYVASIVEKRLGAISEKEGGIGAQAKLVNDMISAIDPEDLTVADGARQLLAVMAENDPKLALGKEAKDVMTRPETSLAQSSLFTGAVHEPQMFSELKKGNFLRKSNRYACFLYQMEWAAAYYRGAAHICSKRRKTAHNHYFLYGGDRH